MLASLLDLSIGLLLVLLLRKPVRRWFGAGPAFTLWLWPLLLGTLPWWPAMPARWQLLPPMVVATAASLRLAGELLANIEMLGAAPAP